MTENTVNQKEREIDAKWYVVHTYSGHENKVKANLDKMVENRGNIDDIFEIVVPTEQYFDNKSGQKKVKERKLFPGYVLIKMIVNDESWYLVRNTRGVTGFVGPQSKPIPLSNEELKMLGMNVKIKVELDANIGDNVKITSGPFLDFVGVVEEINDKTQKLKVAVSMFGRDTSVEIEFGEVVKI